MCSFYYEATAIFSSSAHFHAIHFFNRLEVCFFKHLLKVDPLREVETVSLSLNAVANWAVTTMARVPAVSPIQFLFWQLEYFQHVGGYEIVTFFFLLSNKSHKKEPAIC